MASTTDSFLSKNIARFGLLGNNNQGPLIGPEIKKHSNNDWSLNNHYTFGFNGRAFSHRGENCDFYWVNYSRKPGPTLSLREEMIKAFHEFYRQTGPFSIAGHGGLMSEIAVAICKEAGIPFQILSLDFRDFSCDWPKYFGSKNTVIRTSLKELEQFADFFRTLSPCVDMETIFNAYVGHLSNVPHVYDAHVGLQFTDYNFDQSKVVGAPNWALVDAEKRTAICRFLDKELKSGFVDFFHYSPELMKAYLCHPRFVEIVSEPNPHKRVSDGFTNHILMMKECFPSLPKRNYFEIQNSQLSQWVSQKSHALSQDMSIYCNDLWVTPLSYFVRSWNLFFPYSVKESDYGHVY